MKLVDISGSMGKKGVANTYFAEIMPNARKKIDEIYGNLKDDKDKKEKNKESDIQINRIKSTEKLSSESEKSDSKSDSKLDSKSDSKSDRKSDRRSDRKSERSSKRKDHDKTSNKTDAIVDDILK